MTIERMSHLIMRGFDCFIIYITQCAGNWLGDTFGDGSIGYSNIDSLNWLSFHTQPDNFLPVRLCSDDFKIVTRIWLTCTHVKKGIRKEKKRDWYMVNQDWTKTPS